VTPDSENGESTLRDAGVAGASTSAAGPLELSVVIPCLNEAETLETCIRKARRAMREHAIEGEVVVADNGSTDGTQAIAIRNGARLINVEERGYGHALMAGIARARGRFVVMGDGDDSYDFLEIPNFLARLRDGAELVQGCRLPAGGGRIAPGAMPFSHRWFGNPIFSLLARLWFNAPVHDVYCGLRGFSKELYQRLNQRCTGMEFATEMIIEASLRGARIVEIPITLHPDGRRSRKPHLRTLRDGWRTLRFLLLYSPRWLFLAPGTALILLGLAGYAIALPGVTLRGISFDAHTLLFASLALLCGYQATLFSLFTKTYAIQQGLLPADRRLDRFFQIVNLERGLLASAVAVLLGAALLVAAILQWRDAGFGRLDYAVTMRYVVPGATLFALGFQTALSSFFVSMLGMGRR
jgi:glycosyltransferase involved in cell wall biosynthesis